MQRPSAAAPVPILENPARISVVPGRLRPLRASFSRCWKVTERRLADAHLPDERPVRPKQQALADHALETRQTGEVAAEQRVRW